MFSMKKKTQQSKINFKTLKFDNFSIHFEIEEKQKVCPNF